MTALIAVTFLVLLILGVPIAFVIGVSGLVALLAGREIPLQVLPHVLFVGVDSFPFMAIPFFVLAGEVMTCSGITDRLLRFADVLVGRIRGGLAAVNIVASVVFGGVTGAAVADAAAIGSILIPGMVEKKYPKEYSAAVVASSAVLAPIIPPSIIMVVYGVSAGVSIGALFMGGIIPGLLMGLVMLAIAYGIALKEGHPRRETPVTAREFAKTTFEALPALLMPLIILGGILGGIFTPTEAAAVAVVYALVVGFFVTKALKLSDLPGALKSAALTSSNVLLIIATSKLLGWVLTVNRVPEQVAGFMLAGITNKYVFLALVNILLLIAGCLMDISAACIILVPILLPIATFFQISPLFFGIIMCVNLAIGVVTPPMGPTLFVACNIADVSLEKVAKAALPFVLGDILTIFLLSYAEPLVMWLPRFFGYGG